MKLCKSCLEMKKTGRVSFDPHCVCIIVDCGVHNGGKAIKDE